jgi:hypothetical protein
VGIPLLFLYMLMANRRRLRKTETIQAFGESVSSAPNLFSTSLTFSPRVTGSWLTWLLVVLAALAQASSTKATTRKCGTSSWWM